MKLQMPVFYLFHSILLTTVVGGKGQAWIWSPQGLTFFILTDSSDKYRSTPYQPTIRENEPKPPKKIEVELPPRSVKEETDRVCKLLEKAGRLKLSRMFRKCYPNTLETTTTLLEDNSTFVITGDIDLMWLRDSSAQVHQYLPLAHDPAVQRIMEGVIKRQAFFISRNPYGSSFRYSK